MGDRSSLDGQERQDFEIFGIFFRRPCYSDGRYIFESVVLYIVIKMSFADWAKSLMVVPADYNEIRPHHAVVLYGALKILQNMPLTTTLYKKFFNGLRSLTDAAIPLVYAGLVPDWVIRFGIRLQLTDHLLQLESDEAQDELAKKVAIVEELKTMPIAIETVAANEQHYEVPARFYDLCLVRLAVIHSISIVP